MKRQKKKKQKEKIVLLIFVIHTNYSILNWVRRPSIVIVIMFAVYPSIYGNKNNRSFDILSYY